MLGPRTGPNATFIILKRGPGIEALADVLRRCLAEFPGSLVFKKWIEDLIRAVENIYRAADVSLPVTTPSSAVDDNESEDTTDTNAALTPGMASKKSAKQKWKSQPSVKCLDTKKLTKFDDNRFIDMPEKKDIRQSGAKQNKLIEKVTKPCKLACLIGKIMTYAKNGDVASPAPPARSFGQTQTYPVSLIMPRTAPGCLETCDMRGQNEWGTLSRPPLPIDIAGSDDNKTDKEDGAHRKPKKRVRTDPHGSGGSAIKSKMDIFVSAGKKELKMRADFQLMLLLSLNTGYDPASATTLRDKIILEEASWVAVKMRICGACKAYIRFMSTTAERQPFLVDLADMSLVSHTVEYLNEILGGIVRDIEEYNFSGGVANVERMTRLVT
ncbi:hypothetical protein BV25DRAFT_1843805 [Artomyces pyxidatus]|uniref:Uncharacterized protein n=1 Tax=Artomyces pyxidatus TaxID=48021 RepID=A0ACB8SE83_9AGAM|nr:hypothetical protein BV25DRAFT_1843805 [Artomyces pyxidatus]